MIPSQCIRRTEINGKDQSLDGNVTVNGRFLPRLEYLIQRDLGHVVGKHLC